MNEEPVQNEFAVDDSGVTSQEERGPAVSPPETPPAEARSSEPGMPPARPSPEGGRSRRINAPALIAPAFPASLQSLAATVVIAVFVITFAVQAFQIPSESMENTLLVGDYLLVDKVHFSPSGPWARVLPYEPISRGEIVVFRYPVHPVQHFVKRVVAVPGDRVRLSNKRAWVNGEPLSERYAVFHSDYRESYRDNFPAGEHPQHVEARWWTQLQELVQGGELRVPPGQYFVLGDNRDESLDSRYWGFVPRENIVGRPLLIYFSVGASRGPFTEAQAANDKLARFAQAVGNAVREIRWNRTFRLVR